MKRSSSCSGQVWCYLETSLWSGILNKCHSNLAHCTDTCVLRLSTASTMPLTTKLTRALGIMHPIIQGGMHYVGYAPLVAAVSEAGGIGLVTALTQPSPELLQAEIQAVKAATTKPFGVNLTLLPALKPPNYAAYADVVEQEMESGQLRLIETAGHVKGLEPFIERFKKAGAVVIHKCTQIRHAKTAQRMGADFISMDGFECAGHPGEADVTNWILFAKAARELDVPYVASGGCADGKQLAAALALGCEGMNMGTRFMATVEAPIKQQVKQALVDADESGTTLVMRSVRNTERVFKNETAQQVLDIEREFPGDFSKVCSHLHRTYKRYAAYLALTVHCCVRASLHTLSKARTIARCFKRQEM